MILDDIVMYIAEAGEYIKQLKQQNGEGESGNE